MINTFVQGQFLSENVSLFGLYFFFASVLRYMYFLLSLPEMVNFLLEGNVGSYLCVTLTIK